MDGSRKLRSMKDVADLVGLSRATVSDVINDRWREKGITQKTRDRVMEVIREHHFRPNAVARSLAAGRTYSIGLQLPSSLYEHWTRLQGYIDAFLRRRGFHVVLASATHFHQNEADEIRRLCERQVDGLILSPARGSQLHDLYDWLKRQAIPFVFVGDAPLKDHYSVTDDNVGQARMAVEHLIGLGHRDIAFLHGTSQTVGQRARRRSYVQTLKDHDLPIRRAHIAVGGHDFERSRRVVRRMLQSDAPPTAIYCAADTMALGAVAAAESLGIDVPQRFAIVGHADDIPFIEQHRVPLTTIRQPRQQLAEQAGAMLLQLIDGTTPETKYVEIQGELIVRTSCGGAHHRPAADARASVLRGGATRSRPVDSKR
jgi:LacI family transcriptional regulator